MDKIRQIEIIVEKHPKDMWLIQLG